MINLEAKNVNINDIKEKLKIIFENSFEKFKKNQNLNEIKKEVIEKVFNTFKEYLRIPEENHVDKIYLRNLIKYLYEQNDIIDEFQNYLDAILENYIDFSKLGENKENIIFNYIVDFMQNDMMKEKRKELLGESENKNENKKDNEKDNIYKKIKNKEIITYEEFTQIILEDNDENKFMENKATEYLLYIMKKAVKINSMNAFDKTEFLKFYGYEKKEIKEEKKILICFK